MKLKTNVKAGRIDNEFWYEEGAITGVNNETASLMLPAVRKPARELRCRGA